MCPGAMEKTESTYGLNTAESMASVHQHQEARRQSSKSQTLISPRLMHKLRVIVNFVMNCKLEAFLLVYVTAFSMRLMTTQDLLLVKACLNQLNLSIETCHNQSEEIKSDVSKIGNIINMFTMLVTFIPSAILSIFVGTWSDKYGNKIPIMVAICGGLINDAANLFIVSLPQPSLWWFVLAALPNGLSGCLVCVWAAVYSHATVTTEPGLRTIKFLMISLAVQLGIPLGQFLSGRIHSGYGYLGDYAFSFVLLLGCFVWTLVMVDGRKTAASKSKMLADFFKLDNFIEGVKTTIKERPNSVRQQIVTMLLTMCIIVLNAETSRSTTYYFVKKQYDWTMEEYSNVSSLFALVNLAAIGPMVLIMTKVLGIQDLTMSIIGISSMILQNFTRGFATREWMYYFSSVIGTFGGVSTIGITSHVSRLVSQDEIARMFSFWAACEALVPVLGDVMSSLVFNATIDLFPGTPFIVSSVLLVFPFISLVFIYLKMSGNFQRLEEDANASEMSTSPSYCTA